MKLTIEKTEEETGKVWYHVKKDGKYLVSCFTLEEAEKEFAQIHDRILDGFPKKEILKEVEFRAEPPV